MLDNAVARWFYLVEREQMDNVYQWEWDQFQQWRKFQQGKTDESFTFVFCLDLSIKSQDIIFGTTRRGVQQSCSMESSLPVSEQRSILT